MNFGKLHLMEKDRGEPLEDPTTNYHTHPTRGSIIFVKIIFREKCKRFIFSTSYKNQLATPYVIYETIDSKARLHFGYDYDREPFTSLNSDYRQVFDIKLITNHDINYIFVMIKHYKMKDSITEDIAIMPNGFSFIILYGSWKANLVFNGRLYFINGRDKMLMDSSFNMTKPVAYVSGCDPRKQRIIIRQSPYVDPFNWGSYLWLSNMRALGSIQSDNTIICSLRYFPAGQGSFMLGMYGQRNRTYIHSSRSFMGLTLNHDRTRFLDILSDKKNLFLTLFGAYDENNYILLEKAHDEFDLSIAMSIYDSTIKYRVTGSVSTVYQSECGNTPENLPDPCRSDPDDFYFTCLHVGYYLTQEGETIPNRTASRCTLVGPSPYRSILDRSQKLKYTYAYWEDMALMRMQDEGKSILIIDGIQMIPSPKHEIFDMLVDDSDWF
ncbi:Tryptophan synthase alpha chain [Dirofilaria immitis]